MVMDASDVFFGQNLTGTTNDAIQYYTHEDSGVSKGGKGPCAQTHDIFKDCITHTLCFIYSARNARIASAVLATAMPSDRLSVRPSFCPSVRHTPVLCQTDGT